MSQNYNDISPTEKISESLSTLLERDETGVTLSAGTSFPQELESWMIGRLCLRTDLKALYFLSSVEPVTWTKILDFSQELATKSYVQDNCQPLNNNLTALSNITMAYRHIPYFDSDSTMNVIYMSDMLRNIMNAQNSNAVRSLLELGSLATVDQITYNNVSSYIADNSLSINKFNFTPMTSNQGYKTGDIKESYDATIGETDEWITLGEEVSIGKTGSHAKFMGNTLQNLYNTVWGNPAVSYLIYEDGETVETTKGESALADWNDLKIILLPQGTDYINPNCYYKIKI